MKSFFFASFFLLFFAKISNAQIVINEVAPTNVGIIADSDGDFSDWLELFNVGFAPVNLAGHTLTDGNDPQKWELPSFQLDAGARMLIFASGKNRREVPPGTPNHWETAIFDNDFWQYFVGTAAPANKWNFLSFDAATNWTTGKGGFGYGDGDDSTVVSTGISALYFRKNFTVTNPEKLSRAILSIDYDDGFVAYLNGIEIARSAGLPATLDFTTLAPDHEAVIFDGGQPETFVIDPVLLAAELKIGENVLAIELHNTNTTSSDLTGRAWLHFGVTDASVFFFQNPPFFVSDLGADLEFHTNFKLNTTETLRLFDPAGVKLDEISMPDLQPTDVRARIPDGDSWCFSGIPTPAAANSGLCFPNYATAPTIVLPSGFYANNQSVDIFGGGTIRYTLDGSVPLETSPIYTNSLIISTSSVVRARGFSGQNLPSAVVTATYFINEPTDLPVVSVTAQPNDFFGDGSNGPAIYDLKTGKTGCRIEFFDKNKNLVFAENASASVVGNYSVDFPQKSMQFIFSEEFGATNDVPNIFKKDKPGIEKLHGFRVRNMDDDAAFTRMRDLVTNRISATTYAVSTGYDNVAVFINGQYWGHFGARELLDKTFCRDNFGANPDRVDMIKTAYAEPSPYVAEEGSDTAFLAMSDYILTHSMTIAANWAVVDSLIDWQNWVDYFATEIYINNNDWYPSFYFNNTRLFRAKNPNWKWKFMIWDTNSSQFLGEVANNLLNRALTNPYNPNRYTDMMQQILTRPEAKNYFINRFADLLNLHFNPLIINELIDENVAQISPEIDAQATRWGSLAESDWQNAVADLKQFHTERRPFVRNHIQSQFALAGKVNVTLNAVPAGAGFIQISTIMPDDLPWTGVYFKGIPVQITAVAAPGFTFSNWSANAFLTDLNNSTAATNILSNTTFTANFIGNAQDLQIEISEINYNSESNQNSGDWFELHNLSNFPIDLTGWSVEDAKFYNRFELPISTILPAGGRLVFCENLGKFAALHPSATPKIGNLPFDLSNGGDAILLRNAARDTFLQVIFSDKNGWPIEPDGGGKTLEFLTGMNPNLPISWFAGCFGGSPAKAFDPNCGTISTENLDEKKDEILLFPNPASVAIWLKIKELDQQKPFSVEFFDALGRVVFSKKIAENESLFSVEYLPTGIYQVVCRGDFGVRFGRFLKE
jgi:CotH kinase protein/Lamin Tail Domain/Chitobiase/beta-hexosaminidase C-terminal domain/Secretion system C-terminal sorting domain